jgi:hypothetical protein
MTTGIDILYSKDVYLIDFTIYHALSHAGYTHRAHEKIGRQGGQRSKDESGFRQRHKYLFKLIP